MKILLVIFGLFLFAGCIEENQISDIDVIETDAEWSNGIQYDGCSWHFSVLQKDSSIVNLAADEASLAKIEKAIGTIDGSNYNVSVHMKYSLTGRKKEIECGWGSKTSMDEIKVREITRL
ncbi:hypothetical protein [Dyadobacter sp. NIV53]|uniref:hypothetical protein n=1 Tax=Dyadobacter sp. NIV53 TaxID=2861765 RepID=UPI001C8711B6|nr:hypothetical protein [Dyadobacter sp. NIV53]